MRYLLMLCCSCHRSHPMFLRRCALVLQRLQNSAINSWTRAVRMAAIRRNQNAYALRVSTSQAQLVPPVATRWRVVCIILASPCRDLHQVSTVISTFASHALVICKGHIGHRLPLHVSYSAVRRSSKVNEVLSKTKHRIVRNTDPKCTF